MISRRRQHRTPVNIMPSLLGLRELTDETTIPAFHTLLTFIGFLDKCHEISDYIPTGATKRLSTPTKNQNHAK